MKKGTYKKFEYIEDIADLAKMEFGDGAIKRYGKIVDGLRDPMVYWMMRWFHRGAIVAAFILGLSLPL